MAERGDVVVDGAQPGGRRHAHRLAHALDLSVARVARAEEDGAGLVLQGGARAQRHVDHLQLDAVPGEAVAQRLQGVGSPLRPRLGEGLVDVQHAQLGEHLDVGFVPAAELRSDVHVSLRRSP